eukprot:CAMPEP_0184338118 /NCGR_PEP_ID=MMETSP1089-20130417/6652_1 /TAXON_ID=38269 ORGANISM="Gloeochaete wittrockiana, Strain SAG46.84" /NCGR_SAMPLE_ID=MMETSP1089 /ASSEMBLY_ACC=CAM_ASM_000445 /LENGTH=577 /DNA_ID=CAMNT_0026664421 /DNA_START=82 /DNA_END=1815 /DNA_ORIENTATION=-
MSIVVRGLKNEPYGGKLVDLLVTGEEREQLLKDSAELVNYHMTERQVCDAELLINGGFSPLTGFLNQADYESVVNNLTLADGTFWPMPITLDVSREAAATYSIGQRLNLRDEEFNLIGILTIESIYEPNKALEAEKVLGSPDDICHPSIAYLLQEAGDIYIGGSIKAFQFPPHYDFCDMRLSPKEMRMNIDRQGLGKLIGFQTRNPMHRSHRELTLLAAREARAHVLIHPVVGMTKPGDVDHYTRVRCYKELMGHYPAGMATLSLLPLAMRMGGPREACWHAIIRKNYGCTHFIVGRDHAGPGNNRAGQPFYDPYAAQELLLAHKEDIGIEVLVYRMVVYVEELQDYRTEDKVPAGMRVLNISGTELRRRLYKGIDIPHWFSYPEVVKILRQSYPPRNRQGFTVFFTGLSGSGKSTLANALRIALLEEGSRPVSLLDSDFIRKQLSTELGFSPEHRKLNINRMGFIASEITKHRGVAICAAIAPYAESRKQLREVISEQGGYIEVFVSTPLDVCEARDPSGFYARARRGEITNVAGIDSEYQTPVNPDLVIDISQVTVQQSVNEIILFLEQEGFLSQ